MAEIFYWIHSGYMAVFGNRKNNITLYLLWFSDWRSNQGLADQQSVAPCGGCGAAMKPKRAGSSARITGATGTRTP